MNHSDGNAASGVDTDVSRRVDAVRLRLFDALGSGESAFRTLELIASAVSEATGATVRSWFVDEQPDVRLGGTHTDGRRRIDVAPRSASSGDEMALHARRKGALVRSPGPRGGRFAMPLTHESRTLAVLECALERGDAADVDVAEGVVGILAPAFARVLGHALEDESARAAVARFRSTVDSAVYAIIAIRPDGRIEYANTAATRMFGYELGELIGSPATCLLAGPISNVDRRFVPALLKRAVREFGDERVEMRGRRKDGRVIFLECTLASSSVDERWAFTAAARDVSDRKRSARSLEDALSGERSASRRLRSADRVRRTMLHAVAHEIASPLTVVRGLSSWLLEAHPDGVAISEDDRREALARVSLAAERMSKLLEAFLDLERLESGVLVPERRPTDIGRLVADVIEEMKGVLPDVVFDHEPVVVAVDRVQVETIVRNLLRNAAAHSPAGVPITVRVMNDRDGALLCVEDRGPGVPRSQRRAIFEPFRRGSTAAGDGLGIGLSLVSRFAHGHGGRAWVERPAEGGAAFYVSLPAPGGRVPSRGRRPIEPHA